MLQSKAEFAPRLLDKERTMVETAAANQPPRTAEERDGDLGTVVLDAPRTRAKKKKPSLYRVLLLNDDYTPMEFVVQLLEYVFHKNLEDATRIMLHVHNNGVGVCGVYTYEVAETKVVQAMSLAQRAQHPLQCTMEKE